MSRQISLRLPERVVDDLDRQARRQRRNRSDLIREILVHHALGATTLDHPYRRVRNLVGSVSGGPPDLGARHRAYLKRMIRDRRR
jgi:Arc/MetJ-type ribon-helix-helix transcriptional regulator